MPELDFALDTAHDLERRLARQEEGKEHEGADR